MNNLQHIEVQKVIIDALRKFNSEYNNKADIEKIVTDAADKIKEIVEKNNG